MVDRFVRQIVPVPEPETAARELLFSNFIDCQNIILLGDPGSGKTFLFDYFSEIERGLLFTARTFLNVPSIPHGSCLYIDALDERRSSRGDQNAIDEIVRKLFAAAPIKVRLSCRAQDWLGGTDYEAFRPYFDIGESAVVLHLEALTRDEQLALMRSAGVQDPAAFISEAHVRGLDDFLSNAQTLLLLSKAVESGSWPSSRLELFEIATGLLLSEQNKARSRFGPGIYSSDDLKASAGMACAVRLISDVDGFSLAENSDVPDFPSYRSIVIGDPLKIHAALSRRAFKTSTVDEAVDYIHRTTAEYLGAAWLAGVIRSGLPLSRVRSLIGVDGKPASELRGLHAWLTVHLQEFAEELVEADPYGVLTYGDAGSLSLSLRQRLLDSLTRLSEEDPWFRGGGWGRSVAVSLCKPDMMQAFKAILLSSGNLHIRTIVLEALAVGPTMPGPELQPCLLGIVSGQNASFAERYPAAIAIAKIGPSGEKALTELCRGPLRSDDAAIRLRAQLISAVDLDFTSTDIKDLLNDTLRSKDSLGVGAIWSIADKPSMPEILEILDTYVPVKMEDRPDSATPPRSHAVRNSREVAYTFDCMLLRALQQSVDELTGQRLLKWLQSRQAIGRSRHSGKSEDVGRALRSNPKLLRQIHNALLVQLPADESPWLRWHDAREALLNSIDLSDELSWTVEKLLVSDLNSQTGVFLYDLSLQLCLMAAADSTSEVFGVLYQLAEPWPDLMAVRAKRTTCWIETWQMEESERSAKDQEQDRQWRQSTAADFEKHAMAIKSGIDLGRLALAAKIYFAMFTDVDVDREPANRLAEKIGETNAECVIEGFIALLSSDRVPSLATVVDLLARKQIFEWWYAIIAGLDELWKRTEDLDAFDSDLITTGAAFDIVCPTETGSDSSESHREHQWITVALKKRPHLMHDAYIAVARSQLQIGAERADGLYELFNRRELSPFFERSVVALLREIPRAHHSSLQIILRAACTLRNEPDEILDLIRSVLKSSASLSEEQKNLYIAAGFCLSAQEFRWQLEERSKVNLDVIIRVLDLLADDTKATKREGKDVRPAEDQEFLARLVGTAFENAPSLWDGQAGNDHAWNLSRFVRQTIDQISSDAGERASLILNRLASNAAMSSYHDHIRHALAKQLILRRDAEFRRPTWKQTIETLSNGAPANAADLHALALHHLLDISARIRTTNTDIYKQFWNEDSKARRKDPKPEESCRDVLVGFLRSRLVPLGITVEPEGHMVADKRADISVALGNRKILIELKRDYHAAVWTAAEDQLDRFYTIDPEATGYGIYCVFWFGKMRPATIRVHPKERIRPSSAAEMEHLLNVTLPLETRHRLAALVIDVSGDVTAIRSSGRSHPERKKPRTRRSSRKAR